MYLFTQPIFLPHYIPVYLRRGCLFSLSLSLPVSPYLLLSLTHPFSPPSPPTLTHLLTDSLSQTHTHAHKHTQRHMLCLAGSEPPDYSMPSEELLYLAFIRPKLQTEIAAAGVQIVLEFHPSGIHYDTTVLFN